MIGTEIIDCGVCLLRPWRWDDKSSLVRHANNRQVSRNLRDVFPYPYTGRDADAWLMKSTVAEQSPWVYAIDVAGEAIGGVALHRGIDVEFYSAEIGYWISEEFWGRGIMTSAVRTLTLMALAESDFYRIFAPVFPWNAASMRVLEKAGYQRESVLVRSAVKDGVLIDLVIYAITRDPGLPYITAL